MSPFSMVTVVSGGLSPGHAPVEGTAVDEASDDETAIDDELATVGSSVVLLDSSDVELVDGLALAALDVAAAEGSAEVVVSVLVDGVDELAAVVPLDAAADVLSAAVEVSAVSAAVVGTFGWLVLWAALFALLLVSA